MPVRRVAETNLPPIKSQSDPPKAPGPRRHLRQTIPSRVSLDLSNGNKSTTVTNWLNDALKGSTMLAKKLFLEAVTLCVDYADFLEETIPQNIGQLDLWTIV